MNNFAKILGLILCIAGAIGFGLCGGVGVLLGTFNGEAGPVVMMWFGIAGIVIAGIFSYAAYQFWSEKNHD
jgi:drug/metabolite transporter (DMT)-like permease